MRINVRISTKSLIYSSGNRNPSNKNHRQFLGVESVPECNKLHMKGNHSYLLPQKSPAPPCQLPVGYVPRLFVIWTFIGIGILLFILKPCRLKNPPIQANSAKPCRGVA